MQQVARTQRGWRQWTGRVLPVLAVALLALGTAHGKENDKDKKKKSRDAAVAEQVVSERRSDKDKESSRSKDKDKGKSSSKSSKAKNEDRGGDASAALLPGLMSQREQNQAPVQGIREAPRGEAPPVTSVDRIIEQVERRHKAKVVRVDKKRSGDKQVYELRLLSEEGRVWTVKVDAETGKEI